jgi:hypothetical protein
MSDTTNPRPIKIFDTTLRDGEQSPGCSMNLHEKMEVAQALVDLGVDKPAFRSPRPAILKPYAKLPTRSVAIRSSVAWLGATMPTSTAPGRR